LPSKWHIREAKDNAREGAGNGLYEAAEYGLEVANRSVPLEEGTLERSGFTDVDRDKLTAVIAYDSKYARRQHEEMSYQHAAGRRAKWLEKTMQEEHDAMVKHIGDAIRKALK
jgi:hypothetical protein